MGQEHSNNSKEWQDTQDRNQKKEHPKEQLPKEQSRSGFSGFCCIQKEPRVRDQGRRVIKNGPVNVMEPEPVVRPINKRLEKVDEPIVEKKWESHKNLDSPQPQRSKSIPKPTRQQPQQLPKHPPKPSTDMLQSKITLQIPKLQNPQNSQYLKHLQLLQAQSLIPQKPYLPLIHRNAQYKIDLIKCMFFTQGHNKVYTYDVMQLYRVEEDGTTEWASALDKDYKAKPGINILKGLEATRKDIHLLSKLGTFVVGQNKWGYMIELSAIDQVYDGELNQLLFRCLRIPFFQRLLKKYAYYVLQDKKKITIRDIRSTQNDKPLSPSELSECGILFPHQQQQVGWMLNLQRSPMITVQTTTMIPLFDSGFYFNPFANDHKLYRADEIENSLRVRVKGAILASDVGSGKTASMLFLCKVGRKGRKEEEKTMIVTPDSILFQWAEEIRKFTPEMKYCVFENPSQINLDLAKNVDFVLVSRQTLTNDNQHRLSKIPFKRIILDQVHQIIKQIQKGNRKLFLSQYQTQMMWGVTGTPHNVDYLSNLAVLGELFRFDKAFYEEININVFRRCFIEECIRKNCNFKLLEPVKKEVVMSKMQAVESVLYKAKAQFALNQEEARNICFNILPSFELHKQEKNSLQKGMMVVQARLTNQISTLNTKLLTQPNRKPLQQKLHRLTSQNNFYRQVISTLSNPTFQCIICLDQKPTSDLALTECFHYCCSDCYDMFFRVVEVSSCPVCKAVIQKGNCIIHPTMKNSRNKIEVIVEALGRIEKSEKVIIFTQFHNLVQRIAREFEKVGMPYLELKGVPSEINYRLNIFRNDPSLRILLLSIEQAASGINLTQANHVFFAHPILGDDYAQIIKTYKQCIGRVHRIGQTKPVYAKLFVAEQTIEMSYRSYFVKND